MAKKAAVEKFTAVREVDLITAVMADPNDALVREIYADHLHEQGEARGEDEDEMR
jgi:uncharacterized protein (TIGR02996 family)